MSINIKKMEDSQSIGVVYDISLDGTVVNALGMNVMSNTDGQLGFDFKLPEKFRYTKEHPYVGKGGLNRLIKKGQEYYGPMGDVAEFSETILNKSYNGSTTNMTGLDIDEYVSSSIKIRLVA